MESGVLGNKKEISVPSIESRSVEENEEDDEEGESSDSHYEEEKKSRTSKRTRPYSLQNQLFEINAQSNSSLEAKRYFEPKFELEGRHLENQREKDERD